jgi:hypothetical protein
VIIVPEIDTVVILTPRCGSGSLTPEEALAMLVPRAMRLEAELAHARQRIAEERRRLADKRQVAFIREEHVRREFGG